MSKNIQNLIDACNTSSQVASLGISRLQDLSSVATTEGVKPSAISKDLETDYKDLLILLTRANDQLNAMAGNYVNAIAPKPDPPQSENLKSLKNVP